MLHGRSILLAAVAALIIAPGTAFADGGSLKLSGASKNTLGENFNWTLSGVAGNGANDVVAFEQYYKQSGCASTYKAEVAREAKPAKFGVTRWLNDRVKPGKHYALLAEFGAAHAGVHGVCAYLIKRSSGQTYAHGGGWWDNVSGGSGNGSSTTTSSGKLAPTAVGDGQCEYQQWSDGTVAQQIAIAGATTCATADAVIAGVDSAKGAAYSDDGYTCTATREGAGSQWASAWPGTYYMYSCADGSQQVAFNWGQYEASTGTGTSTSGPLEPTAVGDGQCDAEDFNDGSVVAQVAVSGASCSTADEVMNGADAAGGASYNLDGYTCNATAEGSGSAWASAWGGTYYAYSCADGSDQVAFNWGTDYTY